MLDKKSKTAWTLPVLESIEMLATSTKVRARNESDGNCTGPAQSSSPPGCGS